jgi:1-acyl-sn-glycerol-3-phosphate acyltransferase
MPVSDNLNKDQSAAFLLGDEEARRQMITELEALVGRLRVQAPGYEPPAFSRQRLMALVDGMAEKLPPELRVTSQERLRTTLSENVLDPEVWKGVWYLANYTVQYSTDMVKRHATGEFDTDEWGLDWEYVDAIRPLLIFFYRVYWRVEATGLENIPVEGRALLVVNHAGQLPWDGFMVGTAVLTEHPAQRLVRSLYASLLATMPFVSTLLVRLGQVLATVENGTRLLEQDELVAVFPEGYKGLGKRYADRYKLARFGRGGFIKMALSTGAPIVPVSVVGSEETYITLARLPTLAKVTGVPYLPVTLTFPWLGLLGFVPLPTKWYIDFGEPIPMARYGQSAADDLVLVSQLTDQVRNTIQQMIHSRLASRRSIFFG